MSRQSRQGQIMWAGHRKEFELYSKPSGEPLKLSARRLTPIPTHTGHTPPRPRARAEGGRPHSPAGSEHLGVGHWRSTGSAPPHILSLLLPVLMPGTEETKQTRSCPQEFSIHPGKIKQVHKEPENSWWQVAGAQRQGETKFVY